MPREYLTKGFRIFRGLLGSLILVIRPGKSLYFHSPVFLPLCDILSLNACTYARNMYPAHVNVCLQVLVLNLSGACRLKTKSSTQIDSQTVAVTLSISHTSEHIVKKTIHSHFILTPPPPYSLYSTPFNLKEKDWGLLLTRGFHYRII